MHLALHEGGVLPAVPLRVLEAELELGVMRGVRPPAAYLVLAAGVAVQNGPYLRFEGLRVDVEAGVLLLVEVGLDLLAEGDEARCVGLALPSIQSKVKSLKTTSRG